LTVDRVRGIPANHCCFDEVQDIDYNHVPVILETMGGQKIRLELYAGTSKTLDNTLEGIWSSSSQAEWVIPCQNCKYENVPAMGQDIEKMIGPYRKDISEMAPGVICAKCRSPIHPRKGFWVHKFPERRWTFAG
jgi:phage terminase large subunit GpA-like protein